MEFKNDTQRTSSKRYYLPNVEKKDYYFIIDGKNIFDQQIKKDKITYRNIEKKMYTTGCLLDYTYFKNYYKMIAVDLSKQLALDARS